MVGGVKGVVERWGWRLLKGLLGQVEHGLGRLGGMSVGDQGLPRLQRAASECGFRERLQRRPRARKPKVQVPPPC